MKIKKLNLALTSLLGIPAMAATPEKKLELPKICNTVINYTIQALGTRFADKFGPAELYDPDTLTLKKDFLKYPLSHLKIADECNDDASHKTWCMVAGGQPIVYQVDVDVAVPAYGKQKASEHRVATVVVTYNRGGCRVDEIKDLSI